MKRTQIKDALRNISKQKVAYLSIIVIALLGVSTFLGLDYSEKALKRNGSAVYNNQDFRDIEVVSTLMFSEEDLAKISSAEGVDSVEPVWQLAAKALDSKGRRDVNVISLTESVNKPVLADGRLPEDATECAVESRLATITGWSIGDRVQLQSAAGDDVQYLKSSSFVISGIINHPDHMNINIPDVLYVMVTKDAFDHKALEGSFMKAEVSISRPEGADRYSEGYDSDVEAVLSRLETISGPASQARDTLIHDRYQAEIDGGQRKIDEAEAQLADARKTLDDGWKQYEDGEKQLADAEKQLADSAAQLADAQAQLDSAKAQLDSGKAQLNSAKAQLDSGRAELVSGWEQLEDAKGAIRSAVRNALEKITGDTSGYINWSGRLAANTDSAGSTAMYLYITDRIHFDLSYSLDSIVSNFINSDAVSDEVLLAVYKAKNGSEEGFDAAAQRASIAEQAAAVAARAEGDYHTLHSSCEQWDAGHSTYYSGLVTYNSELGRYNQGLAEYNSGLAQFNNGKALYEQGLADYEAGKVKLADSKKQLEDGEEEYKKGLVQLAEGKEELETAKEQLASLEPCRWVMYGGNGNASFGQITAGSSNLASIKGTFAMLFILVGALVIFATVSKMVDEQRSLVGTTKALGFFNREIFAKYLIFGVSATFIGTILGILTARFALEGFVLKGFDTYFVFDITGSSIFLESTILVTIAGILLAALAVWAACSRLLKSPAIRLMQPKVPEAAKNTGMLGRLKLSLYSRLILLNIHADIKRVIVTIVSVAGCCALIVIGVTFRHGVSGSLVKQYSEIVNYDERIVFDPAVNRKAETQMESVLSKAGTEYTKIYYSSITYQVDDLMVAELFCGDLEEIDSFYHLRDWKTGQPLAISDDGIFIQRRVAEISGLDIGSEFTIALGGTRSAKVRVAGIFEHYIGRPMVMSKAYYEKIYAEPFASNAFMVRLNGADELALEKRLGAIRGFESITSSDTEKVIFESSTSVINAIVALLILMAAIMAGVVLMNLTNMYVLQKKRELTIMRVNGFTVKEVIAYMSRETFITTGLGILLGLALGSGIAYHILRSMEQAFFRFDRSISLTAWLAGAVLTIIFTVIVNIIALKPVKDLKLTDVA